MTQGRHPQIAWCWASGLIEIGDQMPDGAIEIARGPKARLEQVMSVIARHGKGHSAGKLLVPGVPEADTQAQALDVLTKWCAWAAGGNRKGVVFRGAA